MQCLLRSPYRRGLKKTKIPWFANKLVTFLLIANSHQMAFVRGKCCELNKTTAQPLGHEGYVLTFSNSAASSDFMKAKSGLRGAQEQVWSLLFDIWKGLMWKGLSLKWADRHLRKTQRVCSIPWRFSDKKVVVVVIYGGTNRTDMWVDR